MAAWRAVVRVLRSSGLRSPGDRSRSLRTPLYQAPLDALSCALFPSTCRVCHEPLLHFSTCPVCLTCLEQLSPQKDSLCTLCGESLGMDAPFRRMEAAQQQTQHEALCGICKHARSGFAKVGFAKAVAYGLYEDTLRAMIHLLKYERIQTVAEPLGALLAQCVLEMTQAVPEFPADVTVVSVPLYRRKQEQRGFNQTALLAEVAVRVLTRADRTRRWQLEPEAMGRLRETESQSRLTPRERRKNLKGAFFVARPKAVQGRTVLLLDDIYTTGATASECTRTLRAAGAEKVYVATLARSQRDSGVAIWDWTPHRMMVGETTSF